MDTKTKRHFLGAGHLGNPLEKIVDVPQTNLCEYSGTTYNCCINKSCPKDNYCKVKDFRKKYNL